MRRWKLVTWILVTGGALAIAFAPIPISNSSAHTSQVIRVEASQFAYTPGEIRVNQGDTVNIELASTDVVHGIYIDDYGLSVQADPGQTVRLSFVASKPGSFRFRCNVTCGAMHPFMIGKLTVGRNDWLYRSLAFTFLAFILALIPRHDLKRRE